MSRACSSVRIGCDCVPGFASLPLGDTKMFQGLSGPASKGGASLDASKFAYIPIGSGKGVTFAPLIGPIPTGAVAMLFLADIPGASAGPGSTT